VAAAREGGATRALERDVAAPAGPVDELAQEQGAAVAELRREAAELVARVGLRDRLGVRRHDVAGEDRRPPLVLQSGRIEAQFGRELLVEEQQPRRGNLRRLPGD